MDSEVYIVLYPEKKNINPLKNAGRGKDLDKESWNVIEAPGG